MVLLRRFRRRFLGGGGAFPRCGFRLWPVLGLVHPARHLTDGILLQHRDDGVSRFEPLIVERARVGYRTLLESQNAVLPETRSVNRLDDVEEVDHLGPGAESESSRGPFVRYQKSLVREILEDLREEVIRDIEILRELPDRSGLVILLQCHIHYGLKGVLTLPAE